jgi:hypothetical protein
VRCGDRVKDKFIGQSYEHRRGWVEERLLFLSSVFAIDTAATLLALMLWSVISKMLGTFYNSFSWPEGRKAGVYPCGDVYRQRLRR